MYMYVHPTYMLVICACARTTTEVRLSFHLRLSFYLTLCVHENYGSYLLSEINCHVTDMGVTAWDWAKRQSPVLEWSGPPPSSTIPTPQYLLPEQNMLGTRIIALLIEVKQILVREKVHAFRAAFYHASAHIHCQKTKWTWTAAQQDITITNHLVATCTLKNHEITITHDVIFRKCTYVAM